MAIFSIICPHCKEYTSAVCVREQPVSIECHHCHTDLGSWPENEDKLFERCLQCGCRQFFRQKDFNQALGCLIMAFGIVLVPWTYGLSLPVFALLDWILYRGKWASREVAVCYRCGGEYKDVSIPERIKPFMHHIGLKYDKYR